jgi:parallel beta-helix repeat protein
MIPASTRKSSLSRAVRSIGSESFSDGSCTLVRGTMNVGPNTDLTYNNGGFLALDGGLLFVAGNSTLTIASSGATRIEVHQPSTISFDGGSSLVANGLVDVRDNASITIAAGGSFIANQDASFTMGDNASIVVNGTLNAEGSSENRIVFSLREGASQWSGITNTSPPSTITLDHCDIANASTAINVSSGAALSVDQCNFSNNTIGISIFFAPWGPYPPMQITNNTFSNFPLACTGIAIDNYSDILISGNTLTGPFVKGTGIYLSASSPRLLNNTVQSFKYGVICANGSAALFEDTGSGGYNFFTNNKSFALVFDYSDAHLGDEFGENSICWNTALCINFQPKVT